VQPESFPVAPRLRAKHRAQGVYKLVEASTRVGELVAPYASYSKPK